MSQTEQLNFLYESYLTFWDFGSNFDALLQQDTIKIGYRQLVGITDTSFKGVIRMNVQDNLISMGALWANVDMMNGECKRTGVLMGAIMRKLFSF